MPPNLRVLRRKIRSTESIRQITRAMSMVSAVQLRRVQSRVELSQAYFRRLTDIMSRVAASDIPMDHPYLRLQDEPRQVGLVLVAGDRGLCGGCNTAVLRLANQFISNADSPVVLIPIGAKAVAHVRRNGWDTLETFSLLRDVQEPHLASQIAHAIRSRFDDGSVDSLHIIYSHFVSAARHEPTREQLLPISNELEKPVMAVEYICEPDAVELFNTLLPMATEARLRYHLLQSLASEHAARMVAMTTSADNAEKMEASMVRELNRARQQRITDEVLEVVSGAEALG
jgi:F-type H+-transporting ATPase subunit gamma